MPHSQLFPLALVALAIGLALPLSAQHRDHAAGRLLCPVMKSPIQNRAKAPHLTVNFEPVYVCCPGCTSEIKKDPAKYLKQVKDPVTRKPFTVSAKTPKMEHERALFLFASAKTHQAFHAQPGKYVQPAKAPGHEAHPRQTQ